MHPIEQLRYVARANGADAGLLVQEAASGLAVFRNDRPALLTGVRRLLTRQPTIGPLWSMGARLVAANDVVSESRQIIEEIRNDPTAKELAYALPDQTATSIAIAGWPDTVLRALQRRGDIQVLVLDIEGQGPAVVRRLENQDVEAEDLDPARVAGAVEDADLVLIEAAVAGPSAAVVEIGNVGLAATAKALSKPVWLVCSRGRALPELFWQEIVVRIGNTGLPPWLSPHEILSYGLVDRFVTDDGLLLPAEFGAPEIPLTSEILKSLT